MLFDIKVETPRDPVQSTVARRHRCTITEPKPTITFAKVTAPIGGVLSSLTVLHARQSVAIGDTAGQVAPPSFSCHRHAQPRAAVPAAEPADGGHGRDHRRAGAVHVHGPHDHDAARRRGRGSAIRRRRVAQGGSGTGSQTTVRCAVPAEVTVFTGLAADITIAGGKAENVLVVPTTAVKGSAQTGTVWLSVQVGRDGEEEP